ncbi:helix-turn-helix domain-containing protein [Paenibacillus sp. BC26]|uniref:helix-turn-helix domain-containing protein n=1 Tax=Paenibacillus sp. BC26 TaxID=1881032 RepID=UPI0008DF139E|nr:helix-turn-helix domain-containing protein [Paenibacillus sp. BC26]SFS45564.1 transcriptional regulator, AraC family [Paenibacillus sp. BC26]
MYKKLLLTFVASITSLILVLSSLLYYNYNSSIVSTVKGMNENLLSNISYSSVYMDTISKKFCQSLMLNNAIKAFAYSNDNQDEDFLNILGAIRTLKEFTIPNTYIHSTYVYNRQIDTVIDSSSFYNASNFYDKEIIRLINDAGTVAPLSLNPIPRIIPVPRGSDTRTANVYTYILFDNNDYKGNFDSAIVLNVDAEWLRLTISSLNKLGNEIIVLDDQGDIVSHSSSDMFMRNVSNEGYLREVFTASAQTGTYIDRMNREKHVISYVSSDVLKWKFISLTPYDTAFSAAKKNGIITVIFCLIVLLLGLLFAVLASKKLYRPIGALTKGIIQKLGPDSAPSKNMDEMGYLSTAFTGMIDKTQVLENMKRNTTPVIKNEFLKTVVTGRAHLPTDKLIAKQQELQIDLDFRNRLYLFILKIDFYKDYVDRHSDKDRSLYQYAITNIAREITGERFRNEVVETAHDQFAVLADIGEAPDQLSQLTDIFRGIAGKIQASVLELLNLSLTGTLGFVIESPDRIKSAYDEAFNLSMYRIKTGHSSIISPETLKGMDTGSFIFPVSKEKQLIDSLKLGSGEAAKDHYREIIKAIEHSSYDNILTSVIYLFFSIYNSLNRIVEGSESKFNSISISFFNKVSGFETLEEIERTFFELIDEIIVLKDSAKDRKKNDIVNAAIDHIHATFADKNLSLNSCAESLSLSSVYLGKLFKNATGRSVAEYITMVRMEKIKEYLENRKVPINEILERCGVEKSNYFYTSFKKYFGVSLTEYRLKNVNNDR